MSLMIASPDGSTQFSLLALLRSFLMASRQNFSFSQSLSTQYPPSPHPIRFMVLPDNPICDDTLLTMQACPRQLLCLKGVLETFAQCRGIRVNFTKSCLLTIELINEKAVLLAGLLGCKIETFPFTYLGLSLGLSRPRIRDLGPLYSRINHCLLPLSWWKNHDQRWLRSSFALYPPFISALSNWRTEPLKLWTKLGELACGENWIILANLTFWLLGTY
jgi:hypothetical protein